MNYGHVFSLVVWVSLTAPRPSFVPHRVWQVNDFLSTGREVSEPLPWLIPSLDLGDIHSSVSRRDKLASGRQTTRTIDRPPSQVGGRWRSENTADGKFWHSTPLYPRWLVGWCRGGVGLNGERLRMPIALGNATDDSAMLLLSTPVSPGRPPAQQPLGKSEPEGQD